MSDFFWRLHHFCCRGCVIFFGKLRDFFEGCVICFGGEVELIFLCGGIAFC